MAEIRRRKQEAGGDEDAACMGPSISPSITEAEKRNSSAADSSDHMEELGNTWYIYLDYDMRICTYYLWWTAGINGDYFACPSEMFSRNYIDWLSGLIWFIVPVSMIICNDVMAYMFGFFFGKTPLIKLSPKKTWEGFIGGGFATVLFGLLFSYILCHYQYFVCPIVYSEELGSMSMTCQPSYLFTPQDYSLKVLGIGKTISVFPFIWHSIALSLFSSIIGPFGGFFASGFKRAFKIKDFGDMIPGHGGIMDRFDCQFLMATFVNVYISSFIRTPSPSKLLTQIYNLKPEQQLQIYSALKENLFDLLT
ncbi:hypothetical protein GQX74_004525 [Glossina fuscipes]|nr:hypothetical protein GQX74_004525 [Glossina fuscipes]